MCMRYACREVEGTPEPALHSQVAIDQSVIIVKWFLNKRPQRGRDVTVETRSEPYDETCKYRNIASQPV